MPRSPLLDPRYLRLDDILRRPFAPNLPFGASGATLSAAATGADWGFPGGVRIADTEGLAPLPLAITADGVPVAAADAIYRPSYVSLNGVDAATGLQVTEDKFVSGDDALVSVLSFRNSGDWSVDVEVSLKWGVRAGQFAAGGETLCVARDAPRPEERRLQLGEGRRHRMAFVLAAAPGEFAAKQTAWRWAGDANPAQTHAAQYQAWFDENAPRFDCPDPYLTKLWYYCLFLLRQNRGAIVAPADRRWLAGDANLTKEGRDGGVWAELAALPAGTRMAAIARRAREQFAGGDFDAPFYAALLRRPFALDAVVTGLLGLHAADDDTLRLHPLMVADGADGWRHFCLENLRVRGHRLTIVWDDPAAPGDHYDDGDKGFTVYAGDAVIHRQADLSPCHVTLLTDRPFDDEDDE